jgi:tRNA-dihydrouridine synthase C
MVEGRVPVTVKMRSGFENTSLFDDNLLAIQSAGASCVTVHPRTRNQGYHGRADWSLVMRAEKLLSIPVVCTQVALS